MSGNCKLGKFKEEYLKRKQNHLNTRLNEPLRKHVEKGQRKRVSVFMNLMLKMGGDQDRSQQLYYDDDNNNNNNNSKDGWR